MTMRRHLGQTLEIVCGPCAPKPRRLNKMQKPHRDYSAKSRRCKLLIAFMSRREHVYWTIKPVGMSCRPASCDVTVSSQSGRGARLLRLVLPSVTHTDHRCSVVFLSDNEQWVTLTWTRERTIRLFCVL